MNVEKNNRNRIVRLEGTSYSNWKSNKPSLIWLTLICKIFIYVHSDIKWQLLGWTESIKSGFYESYDKCSVFCFSPRGYFLKSWQLWGLKPTIDASKRVSSYNQSWEPGHSASTRLSQSSSLISLRLSFSLFKCKDFFFCRVNISI